MSRASLPARLHRRNGLRLSSPRVAVNWGLRAPGSFDAGGQAGWLRKATFTLLPYGE